jgi:transcriptional regulator with XRE-family HTH domain
MEKSSPESERIARELASVRLTYFLDSQSRTRAEVARLLNISKKSLYNYENGIRELPQSVRLRFIAEFHFDPIPTDLMYHKLGLSMPNEGLAEQYSLQARRSFWKNPVKEIRAFRLEHHSQFHQRILQARDEISAAMAAYLLIKTISFLLEIPISPNVNGIDWMLAMASIMLCSHLVWVTYGTVRFFRLRCR